MIVKDDTEAKILKRALNSVAKHVDGIFLTGTKEPQEKIKKIATEYGATYSYFPWIKDFAAARNFAYDQVTKDYQWIFWMDTDDIVSGAESFRKLIPLAEANNVKALYARYLYQVELDEKGAIKNILIEHLRERLTRNDGTYRWVGKVHETLIEQVPAGQTDVPDFVVIHLASKDEMLDSMKRNMEILESEVMNNPNDPRPIYYLAKAYFDTRLPEILYDPLGPGLDSLAMELIKDYLRKSGWPEERAQAWEYLAMLHRERGEYKKSLVALLESENEWPQNVGVYIQKAMTYVMMKDWAKALHFIKMVSNLDAPKTTLVTNMYDYKRMILECLFHIYANTGQLDETERVVEGLMKLSPDDLNKQRFDSVKDLRHRNNLAHWVVKLAHHLKETNQTNQLQSLVLSIPKEIAGEPALIDLRNEFLPPKTWEKDEVVIYCGPGFEKWSPKNVLKGIGGSEEAVIYMSKELVKLGWKVTVYGDPMEDAGLHDGVAYVPYYQINWNDNFNVLIAWRNIGIFDLPIKAKKTYLWNHDLQNPLTYTPDRVAKIDKVMFLSKFHRNTVPDLPEDKIMYTANGVNREEKRDL